jgi:hypothetical protein
MRFWVNAILRSSCETIRRFRLDGRQPFRDWITEGLLVNRQLRLPNANDQTRHCQYRQLRTGGRAQIIFGIADFEDAG